MNSRIALIHALRHSPEPIAASFRRLWPEAQLTNILDDSLSSDLSKVGYLDEKMFRRFDILANYAIDNGAQSILFTCSAFGPCIDSLKKRYSIPILKPNEAMMEATAQLLSEKAILNSKIGLLATFGPTITSMTEEFQLSQRSEVRIKTALAVGALEALNLGDLKRHDEIAAQYALQDLSDCDVIALAQYSLARAAPLVASLTGLPVLTTTDSSVLKLKSIMCRS
mmetsp:Transcript_33358/g.48351  ORF Transcript_33358/g.48351 Transcript_33358/m.48351 type:complete len:225 (+) Transcript_33358:36-710(+)